MSSFSLLQWVIFAAIVYVVWRLVTRKSKPATPPHNVEQTQITPPTNGDAWEGAFWDVASPKPADVTVHLLYKDGAGQRTKRTVHVKSFDSDSEGLILGYCLLRDQNRTFRYDRIERAIDPATGEVIGDLHDWLEEKYNKTPQGRAATLASANIDLFKVLLYVAKADGSMRAAEVEVIANSVATITGNPEIDSAVTKAALGQLDTPTLNGFKMAFSRLLARDAVVANKAWQTAKDIVNTQKTVHAVEQAALDYLDKAMRKVAVNP